MNTAETIELLLYKKAFAKRNDAKSVENLTQVINKQVKKGIAKYGAPLDAKDLTNEELINHAIEEGIDLAFYLTKIFKNTLDYKNQYGNCVENNGLADNLMFFNEQAEGILETCLKLEDFKNSGYFKKGIKAIK